MNFSTGDDSELGEEDVLRTGVNGGGPPTTLKQQVEQRKLEEVAGRISLKSTTTKTGHTSRRPAAPWCSDSMRCH